MRPDNSAEISDTVLTASRREVAQMEFELNKRALRGVFAVMVVALGALALRTVYMMTYDSERYVLRAASNSVRDNIIVAPRGMITDRFGEPLVENVPQTDVVALTTQLPSEETKRAAVLAKVAEITGEHREDMMERVETAIRERHNIVVIAQNLSQEQRFAFTEAAPTLPGVRLVHTPRRHYIDSTIFAHIIGYTGIVQREDIQRDPTLLPTDHVGRNGVEKYYEHLLRGRHGATGVEVDARLRPQRITRDRTVVPGNDLSLTIDAAFQKAATEALEASLTRFGLSRGAVVALDPRDGSIRALVSLPSYDNNLFIGGIDPKDYSALINDENRPLFHRAIAGAYPPGSTVKPMLAAAALAEGVIDETTTVNSTGAIRVQGYTFRDWRANGVADVRRAIAVSHDIFFYAIGGGYGGIRGMGMDTMKRYYTLFGFGQKTGIDLPGEVTGLIPDPAWKQERFGERWTIGNSYHAAIGQGYVTATPLQVAVMTAAIANGGTVWRPHILAYHRTSEGSIISYKPRAVRTHIMAKPFLRVAQEGMRAAVTEGTARALSSISLPIAAKTGTAQFGAADRTHSWMATYAPYDKPTIVIVVLVEAQRNTTSGSIVVARQLYEWYAEHRTTESVVAQD